MGHYIILARPRGQMQELDPFGAEAGARERVRVRVRA